MTKDVTIQIGNSDNKLTQVSWSDFVSEVDGCIESAYAERHFSGFSNSAAPWQNAAWCFIIEVQFIPKLKLELADIAHAYKQDSVAWVEGQTEFIKANKL